MLFQSGVDQTIACAQEHNDHEDTPRHSETRERRAELVPPRRTPYFC